MEQVLCVRTTTRFPFILMNKAVLYITEMLQLDIWTINKEWEYNKLDFLLQFQRTFGYVCEENTVVVSMSLCFHFYVTVG